MKMKRDCMRNDAVCSFYSYSNTNEIEILNNVKFLFYFYLFICFMIRRCKLNVRKKQMKIDCVNDIVVVHDISGKKTLKFYENRTKTK